MKKTIAIGNDHAGTELKKKIIDYLKSEDYVVKDFGTNSEDSVDYPDFAHPTADFVKENNCSGILICGSGNGINMTANKHTDIRSALCWTPEIARLAREHNNANIVTLPARYIDTDTAMEIVKTFLSTEFEGGRHERRVNKIKCS